MKTQNAFTLVELIITIAIAGILMAMAAPNFSSMLKNNSLAIHSNTFLSHLNSARSESIKRGNNVVLCKSNTGNSCITANFWEQGWIIFSDTDNDNTLDSGEEVLRVHEKLNGLTLRGNGNYPNRIVYRPTGMVSLVGTLVLCADINGNGDLTDAEDFAAGHAIIISRTGRARSAEANTSSFTNCTTP